MTLPSAGSRGSGEEITYALFEELPALVWAANLAALELHVPQWTVGPGPARRPPDRLVFTADDVLDRVDELGDLFADLATTRVTLPAR